MPVQKTTSSFPLPPDSNFRGKALQWAAAFPYCSYFTSNNIPYPKKAFPELLAVSEVAETWPQGSDPFQVLQELHDQTRDWLFGYFTYDLKNSIHGLESKHPDSVGFPESIFYRPQTLLFFRKGAVEIQSPNPQAVYEQIQATTLISQNSASIQEHRHQFTLRPHMSREAYLQKVKAIKNHILEGDCYELNLCQEFSATEVHINPLALFLQLNQQSPTPFASFQRFNSHYLMCASPERFLKKEGDTLISQPIKGTIRRGNSAEEDEQLKQQLRNDDKELAENMMIVDLVRNDLARSALPGSVKVDELFGIYSFRQVHQMISTVRATLRPGIPFTEAIKNAFPMGSMTGAPKRKVMELIEQYENSRRGLYSGSVGFITPAGDFDFNVVIRSMLYNAQEKVLSFQVGGAITYDSVPEKEYEECLLKASAMLQVLGLQNIHPFSNRQPE
jgi:para-aminobenzoate synthetase component 1